MFINNTYEIFLTKDSEIEDYQSDMVAEVFDVVVNRKIGELKPIYKRIMQRDRNKVYRHIKNVNLKIDLFRFEEASAKECFYALRRICSNSDEIFCLV